MLVATMAVPLGGGHNMLLTEPSLAVKAFNAKSQCFKLVLPGDLHFAMLVRCPYLERRAGLRPAFSAACMHLWVCRQQCQAIVPSS